MATHSSILAWRISWTRGALQVTVSGVAKSWTWLMTNTHTHTHTQPPSLLSLLPTPTHPISPMRSSSAPGWAPWAAQQLTTSCLFYI